MHSLWQDVRYGLRGLRGNPGFSTLAVVTLALGIGAGTTMFSVIKNVLLSPFPYKDPNILGRTFVLNGKPATLVGIMPKRFTKRGAEVWVVADINRTEKNRWWVLQAKLKPGVSRKQAEATLMPIAQSWAKDHPKDYP